MATEDRLGCPWSFLPFGFTYQSYSSSWGRKLFFSDVAWASSALSGSSPKRSSIVLRIESVSYCMWSTKRRLASGPMMIAGTRVPSPQMPVTGGVT